MERVAHVGEQALLDLDLGKNGVEAATPPRILDVGLPPQLKNYPEFRYMGSKHRLLPWIYGVLRTLDFESALDPFCGTGCVAYLMKVMGKTVTATDFLNFPAVLASATIANSNTVIDRVARQSLLKPAKRAPDFIQKTFTDIFFTVEDLKFLDRAYFNLMRLDNVAQRALAKAALIRSCLKKQPRGVFTVSGDLSRYDDGRRDLRLSIEEHFLEQLAAFNQVIFDNGRTNCARRADVFEVEGQGIDLVYLDPPYVPRSDDNCYVKRYHFLEGLSCYWDGLDIMPNTKVKKIEKPYTPFSYRRTALEAFDGVFRKFRNQIIVLSYSSNGFPDRDTLEGLLRRYKSKVSIYEKPHRYHFGTHPSVARAQVQEYLFVAI